MIVAIASGFLLIYSLLLFYYKIIWDSIDVVPTTDKQKARKKISVIIPARNEEENIAALLASIKAQRFPAQMYEVLVVDDFSTDQTAPIVKSYPNVRYYHLSEWADEQRTNSFKKAAITGAIERADGDIIVTTDADCVVGDRWLQSISQAFESNEHQAIAGPVIFIPASGLLYHFQLLDFMSMQGITAAVLTTKQGAMCNGANFAYLKNTFNNVNGYEGADHLASGDDMMLMSKFMKEERNAVAYLKSSGAIVQTKAMESLSDFIQQRIRWASKNKSLSDWKIQSVLLFVWLMNASLLLALFSLFLNFDNVLYVIILFVIKGVAEYFFAQDLAVFFKRKNSLPFLFILQPLHVTYMTVVGLLGLFNTYTWKQRKVK